jgi:hypothetical protein
MEESEQFGRLFFSRAHGRRSRNRRTRFIGQRNLQKISSIQTARKVEIAYARHWFATRVRNNDGYPIPRISYESWYALRLFIGEGEATAAAALLAA